MNMPMLARTDLTFSQGRITRYSIIIPYTLELEHVLRPYYWSNVAHELRQNDEITLIREDGAWRCHAFVKNIPTPENVQLEVESLSVPQSVEMAIGLEKQLRAEADARMPPVPPNSVVSIDFAGREVGWRVLMNGHVARRADGMRAGLLTGLGSRYEAALEANALRHMIGEFRG